MTGPGDTPRVLICGHRRAVDALAGQWSQALVLGEGWGADALAVLGDAARGAAAALVTVEAERGLDTDARRLAHLAALLEIPRIVLVVGGAPDREAFDLVAEEWAELAERVGIADVLVYSDAPGFGGPPLASLLGAEERGAGTPQRADQLQATLIWGHGDPLLRGRSYGLRIGGQTVTATVAPLKYRINLDTLVHTAASKLECGEVGVAALELSGEVAFAPHAEDAAAGSFELTDPLSGHTVGIGLIQFALRRALNVRWQPVTVDRAAREAALAQRSRVIWLTGLSGAGKSTIANLAESELLRRGRHTYLLDGDNVRHGLNRDLGFTDADRVENIRRVAEVARLMLDAGLIVFVSFISPFARERFMARNLFAAGDFFEVHVDTPLAVAEQRDPKGLYAKARRGELRNFTGIDSPYEPPEDPELRIDTTALTPAEAAAAVLALLDAPEGTTRRR